MTDRGSPLPSTWIPRDLYKGPARPEPGVLKLDGNEGNPPPRTLLEDLAAADLSQVRDYPDARPLESEIAERLHVSVGTVQFHLSNIYGQLGARSRAEAIVRAARAGMVVIDE